ncbi:VanY-A/VanY-F/VanY-M family D-Ala-D-Ala carboxypeptidase [Paenibacillus xerothermodurans]|uniref:VanY-A/VanY-F/VanY-M family D-Ala-D-Ala carboxypeptidase n=1 Tax=Paenibacillus xerothermodurans TaxID=1977292 RepID=A0A2W1N5C4_PAEXE|nr:VanY-A/VanY-F/VanY-M family D-Ala-D-Ala carboxypeptidase [Paenibacillus xerothermodurans]PZE19014.1 VanY-A/VanY-F/VanY-M family D-Ala-D-Ala carboxypeptidase [Paenibacillus xerothermodurans]
MKKWLIGLIILLILGYGVTQYKPKVDKEKLPEINYQVQDEIPQESDLTIQVTKDQIYKGNLLLVNKHYPVHPEGVEPDAVALAKHQELVNGFVLLDNSIRLSRSLVQKFTTMIEAAEKDGVNRFLISSGYRDNKEQNELYQQMGAEYALPAGYSEHNLGLSLDIGSTQAEMSRAPEGKWLKKNAWSYGFILRYPSDKTAITGIQFEPWHFRYVGLPHSAIMYEKDFVLEEYLDFLKQQKSITTTIENQVYEIFYYPISKNTTIHVPANGRYEISGNNMDGVIVTVYVGTRGEVPMDGIPPEEGE